MHVMRCAVGHVPAGSEIPTLCVPKVQDFSWLPDLNHLPIGRSYETVYQQG